MNYASGVEKKKNGVCIQRDIQIYNVTVRVQDFPVS